MRFLILSLVFLTACLCSVHDEAHRAYLATLRLEAPETLQMPVRRQFVHYADYLRAVHRFETLGNWATEPSDYQK